MAQDESGGGDLGRIIQKLGDAKHLNREKGLIHLQDVLNNQGQQDIPDFMTRLKDGIKSLLVSDVWERKLGGLIGCKAIVDAVHDEQFEAFCVDEVNRLLEDDEVRVRQAVGDLLQSLARKRGVEIFDQTCDSILTSIYTHYDREGEGEKEDPEHAAPELNDLLGALLKNTYKPRRPGEGELRHGSEGWKCLETSMKAFQQLVEGVGPAVGPRITPALLQLLLRSVYHPNRFVRETTHFTTAALCGALGAERLLALGAELAPRLADGLSDNWSQVRFSASVAARAFLTHLPEGAAREGFFPVLLPPMCLNRYYVAEGVRLYSQESWRLVSGGEGRRLVAQYIDKVVEYYIMQSKASNHAVREAACACIAELMEKVDKAAVRRHVRPLVRALLVCFRDMSWPVRDAACTACGRCVVAYPEECRGVVEELLALWVAHLWDNIPTVRENSATALANCIRAYGESMEVRVVAATEELLPMAYQQPEESAKYSDLENTSQFGVVQRRARDNDPQVHMDQDMFSCGSLVARFSTSYLVKSDGCMDYGFARDKQPWEASDGAIYMVRELAVIAPARATALLPKLEELARLRSFQHAFHMHETLWRCLPAIARGIGKRAFKAGMEGLVAAAIEDLRCGHQLTEVAAGTCLAALRQLVGPSIFDGRLAPDQLQLMHAHLPPHPPPGTPATPMPPTGFPTPSAFPSSAVFPPVRTSGAPATAFPGAVAPTAFPGAVAPTAFTAGTSSAPATAFPGAVAPTAFPGKAPAGHHQNQASQQQ